MSSEAMEYYFGVPFESKRKAATALKPKFKNGDKVRVIDNGGGGKVGDVGVVIGRYDNCISTEGYYYKLSGLSSLTDGLFERRLALALPTFAPNTRVRLIRNTQRYAVGDTGTVTVSSDESVGVRMDDGRYWSFKPEDLVVVPSKWTVTTDHNGFVTGIRSDHAPPANDPAQPCIVMRLDEGEPRPSNYPHVHPSADSATKEAERLASVNPGKQFDVYQRVTGRVGEQHIEMKVA